MNAIWTTREGVKIQVKDMKLSHVENTLKMLIRKYTEFCLNHGARHTPEINLDKMTEDEKRSMLNQTCIDRTYLRRLVANSCFGYDIYSEVMNFEND